MACPVLGLFGELDSGIPVAQAHQLEAELGRLGKPHRVVVYPEATWYGHVTVDDVDEIIDRHILGGKPVERLVLPPEKLTGIDPRNAAGNAPGAPKVA